MQTDIKRLVLAGIFIFSMMTLFANWEAYKNPQKIGPVATVSEGAGSSAPAQSQSTPDLPQPTVNTRSSQPSPAVLPDAQGDLAAAYKNQGRIVVETDLLRAEISELGGDIIRVELLKHFATDDNTRHFVILDDGKAHTYVAQAGLLGKDLPNHKSLFKAESNQYSLKEGQDKLVVKLVSTTPEGVSVSKALTFNRGSYLINQGFELTNRTTQDLQADAYFQLTRDSKPTEGSNNLFTGVNTYTGPAFYTEAGKFEKVAFDTIGTPDAKFVKLADNGWVSMIQHYFVSALIPKAGAHRENYVRKTGELFSAGAVLPVNVAANQSTIIEVPLYVGPQEQNKLKEIAPGLNLVVDYGILKALADPLFWVLSMIHEYVIANWGWSIILVTILIKLAFYPLSAASYRSMAKMKAVMPRLKALQEKHAGDRMKLNQEMMELYKKEKINPMGGCLPMLVQIPVFIAFYWMLIGVVEMRQAPWLGWITDLSAKDPYFVLPIVMGITQVIQMKLNPPPPDPMQAKIMMMMPILFTGMSLFFPSGLVLYWVVNSVLSIAQQWAITRSIEGGTAKG